MIWISLGQLPGWESSHGTAADPNRLASFLGLMAQSNSDQGADRAPPESDRRTGELFGRRIALITRRWTTGHETGQTPNGRRFIAQAGGRSRQ